MELFSLLAKLTLDSNDFSKGLDEAQREADSFEDPSSPKLELDNDDFNSGIEESQSLGDGFGKNMESVFGQIKTALTVTGIVGAIAGIVNGLKEAVNLTAETADGIDKGSKQLGISTKYYQQWDHAMRQSGASIQDVRKGLANMRLAMQAANPLQTFAEAEDQVDRFADKTVGMSGEVYEAFRDLKLIDLLVSEKDKSDAEKTIKSTEDLMAETLKRLAAMDDTNQRGILVSKLFGKGGDVLNAMLDEGADGIDALLQEAESLGLIMSDDEINQAVAYGDAVANLNDELNAIKMAFVQDIIPVLTDAVHWLTDFLTKLNPRLQTSSIFDVFNQIDAKTLIASKKVDEANATAKKLIEDLQKMGDYWSLDEQGRMTWDALASKALELFPQLSDYIDKDGKKIQGNTDDIEANIDAWSRLEKQRLLSAAMDDKREAVAKQLIAAYEKGAEAAAKEAEAEGKRAKAIEELNKHLSEENQLSEDASFAEFQEARTDLLNTINPDTNLSLFNEVSRIGSDWASVTAEATNMRTEADKMISEAEEANSKIDEYERRLAEQMGMTSEEIRKARLEAEEYTKTLNNIPRHVNTRIYQSGLEEHTHAIGSAYIPYDNYPALLHRGEKILTATEARQGDSSGIDFTAMEDSIVAAIRAGMDGATVRSYLNGREITAEVNRQNINDVKGRRFST